MRHVDFFHFALQVDLDPDHADQVQARGGSEAPVGTHGKHDLTHVDVVEATAAGAVAFAATAAAIAAGIAAGLGKGLFHAAALVPGFDAGRGFAAGLVHGRGHGVALGRFVGLFVGLLVVLGRGLFIVLLLVVLLGLFGLLVVLFLVLFLFLVFFVGHGSGVLGFGLGLDLMLGLRLALDLGFGLGLHRTGFVRRGVGLDLRPFGRGRVGLFGRGRDVLGAVRGLAHLAQDARGRAVAARSAVHQADYHRRRLQVHRRRAGPEHDQQEDRQMQAEGKKIRGPVHR